MGAEGFNTAEPAYDSHTISESDRMLQHRLLRTLGVTPGTPTTWASALSLVQVLTAPSRPWRVVTVWRAWRAGRLTLLEATDGLWRLWTPDLARVVRNTCLGIVALLLALVGGVVLAVVGLSLVLVRAVRRVEWGRVNWAFCWGVIVGVSATSIAMLVLGWLAVTARADANAWEILGR